MLVIKFAKESKETVLNAFIFKSTHHLPQPSTQMAATTPLSHLSSPCPPSLSTLPPPPHPTRPPQPDPTSPTSVSATPPFCPSPFSSSSLSSSSATSSSESLAAALTLTLISSRLTTALHSRAQSSLLTRKRMSRTASWDSIRRWSIRTRRLNSWEEAIAGIPRAQYACVSTRKGRCWECCLIVSTGFTWSVLMSGWSWMLRALFVGIRLCRLLCRRPCPRLFRCLYILMVGIGGGDACWIV